MSNNAATTVTTNILPVQALYDPTTLAFITFIGPAGLPFTSAAGGVSSVDVSGGTTGLTTTGGPIVSSGTITLGGTLSVSNGGTGATTATGAINNLLPSQATHAGKYLTTDGTNTSWSTSGANLSVVNDTSTNATRYLTFTDVNTGVITQEYVSSSKLTYNPSSGTVTATTFVGALTGNASTATLAASSTNIAGGANGSLPYQTGSGTTTFLAAGSNGQFLTLSGGVPTWSSLSYVSSFSAGTTGFTPNVSTTGAVTLSGTLNVANGGTGVTSSSGANSVVLRDANANTSANDFYEGFTNVAAAGTTITLTAASTPNFVITGSGGQTYKLPDATTIPTGAIYTFNNNQTSGAISVQNSSGTLVVSVPSGGFVEIILLTNSVAAGTWDYHFQAPSNVSWSTNTFSYAGSITNATWNGVSIGAIYGGTGQTSYTTGDTLYASASNTLSKLAIGSTGQVLTVSGGVPTWANTSSATTITDDTTTNATRYINFTSATSGSLTNIGTSSTKLQYNPSTGTITAPSITTTSDATIHGLTVGLGGGSVTSNTAVGYNALLSNSTGIYLTAFGLQAGKNNTTGNYVTAIGANAGFTGTGNSGDTYIGYSAGFTKNNGDSTYGSTFVGYFSGYSTTTGTDNTFVGAGSGLTNTTGGYNAVLGMKALYSNSTGNSNTAIGAQALTSNTTASSNTAVGYQAAYSNTSGVVTAVGRQALYSNTTGICNTAVGGTYSANPPLYANTTGNYNSAFGEGALAGNTTASNNTAVGYQAGYANTTGRANAFFGAQSGYNNTTGYANTAVGMQALFYNTTGLYNTAVGSTDNTSVPSALYNNTTGNFNTAVGTAALQANTTASNNTAVGYQAGYSNTIGERGTFIGYQAGYSTTTNFAQTMIGFSAGLSTTGANSTFVGYNAGNTITTGAKNTILGTYNGNQGGLDIRTASNRVVLSDGDGNIRIACDATGSTANGYFMAFDGLEWYPGVDNAIALGTASKRYTVVYATTALINTSDANLKQQIRNLSDAEKSVATKIKGLIKSFKFNDSVAKKGDGARIHIGVIAQDVQSAFIEQNLDPNKYAMFCSDTWYEVNGSATLPNGEFCKKDDEGAVEVTQLGIRYEELLAFVISSL